MEIRSLAGTDFDAIAEAFGKAFADYDVQITSEQLRTMLRRRGFDEALSFAAFDEGRIAAFTLNGIGNSGGVPTAYDTGTGTLPEYRGRKLASRIFEVSLPDLRKAGIKQYLLEVLQHNEAAISVYRGLGLEVRREFNYFMAPAADVRTTAVNRSADAYTIRPTELATVMNVAARFIDFEPSWQNSFEAVERAAGDFVILGAFDDKHDGRDGMPAGYCIFEPAAGDITQIAVAKYHRRQGIGSKLLGEMLRLNCADTVKCINTDVSCRSIAAFMQAHNIPLAGHQFEITELL